MHVVLLIMLSWEDNIIEGGNQIIYLGLVCTLAGVDVFMIKIYH